MDGQPVQVLIDAAWLWLDYCLSYCMPNIMFMGKPACMYSTASYCEANQWLLIKATIEAVATNLLVTFLLERDIYGQASILGQAQGLVVVTQLRAAMKGWGMIHLAALCRGMTRIWGGKQGSCWLWWGKGCIVHTEQILELYIVNFWVVKFYIETERASTQRGWKLSFPCLGLLLLWNRGDASCKTQTLSDYVAANSDRFKSIVRDAKWMMLWIMSRSCSISQCGELT